MKGKLSKGPGDHDIYTDARGQAWVIQADTDPVNVARGVLWHALPPDGNIYGLPKAHEPIASGGDSPQSESDFIDVLDDWVDGHEPKAVAKSSGGGIIALLILLALVFSDKRKR
jgi:hypothetical protein